MNKDVKSTLSRRELLGSGAISAGSALTALSAPAVHAGGRDLIQLAIVGCGGRGTGAVLNALGTRGGPIKLIAMADAYADRLSSCVQNLAKPAGAGMEVPPDRKFVGFDAYRSAMDQLRPGDIVILTTPPAFRWVHFQYAIRKRLNVFMEKPV
ncbi:MAG TPA: hypothetical protein VGS41_10655, partial [Chthonomonadales bacterium]|nr:hypothetical protein [Chthonomonadales bacterium]